MLPKLVIGLIGVEDAVVNKQFGDLETVALADPEVDEQDYSYLIRIGPVTIPEPLNIDGNDSPVNGRGPILHLPSSRQGKQVLVTTELIFGFTRPGQVRMHAQC
jgi:hypothetical protein